VSSRRKIEDKVRRKEQEIAELEAQIREARAYIQALNDALKVIPKDKEDTDGTRELRPGSMMAEAREAIRRAGKPLHISELLDALGKEKTRSSRASLAGSLAAYVRKGEIFTRPKPNTFGLVGMDVDVSETDKPPPDFGIDQHVTDDESPF